MQLNQKTDFYNLKRPRILGLFYLYRNKKYLFGQTKNQLGRN